MSGARSSLTDSQRKVHESRALALLLLLMAFTRPSLAEIAIEFVEQPVKPLPGITQYAVFTCNSGESLARLSGGLVYKQAAAQGISGVTRSALLARSRRAEKLSWQRRTALALEYAAWLGSGLAATEVIRIREDLYKALLPGGALSLRTITTAIGSETPTFSVPDDMVPPFLEVSPNQCVEHSFFGWRAK